MGELHGSRLPIDHRVVLLQPCITKDKQVLSKVCDLCMQFFPMTVVLHGEGSCVHDIARQVAGSVDVKDANRIGKWFEWESQPFDDRDVDKGSISPTVQ